jgi:hypothetical protein
MPPEDGRHWIVVRTSAAAIAWMRKHGIPEYISFDHDLGDDDTGMKVAYWMAKNLLEPKNMTWAEKWFAYLSGDYTKLKLPRKFRYYVHSQNPVGKQNIERLMQLLIEEVGKDKKK